MGGSGGCTCFPTKKKLEKRLWSKNSSNNNNKLNTIKMKLKVKSQHKSKTQVKLQVDCVRVGLKNKSGGSRWGAFRGWRELRPPAFAKVLAFPPRKSFEKRLWSKNNSNNNTNERKIIQIKK